MFIFLLLFMKEYYCDLKSTGAKIIIYTQALFENSAMYLFWKLLCFIDRPRFLGIPEASYHCHFSPDQDYEMQLMISP